MIPPQDLAVLKPPLWNATFLTYVLINLCIFMGFDMLLPTLSLYLVAQGCPKEIIGIIFACFAVSAVSSRLVASRLSQFLGPLRVLKLGLLFCGLGAILFFAMPQAISYALARFLFGAGYGLTSTLMISMAAQTIPPSRLGEGLGYLGLGATVALAIGPMVGLTVAKNFGYVILFSSVAVCYLLAMGISLTLPKVTLAFPDKKRVGWLETLKLLSPALKTSFLIFIYGLAVCGVSAYLAVYCEEKNLPSAASFFVISTIGTLFSRVTSGRVYDRFGHRMVVPPAVILVAVSIFMVYLAQARTSFYAAAIIYGLGAGSLFPALQAMTLASTPLSHRTGTSALFYNAFDVGIGLGVTIMGFFAGYYQSYAMVYLLSSGLMALALVIYALFFAWPIKKKA
ncbi:MAG: MFS transporter [Deltaproteobacteria bacterium]|jgi:MFS family permease|nr:MFS transporter [Deltaproteobacteria bacterium]